MSPAFNCVRTVWVAGLGTVAARPPAAAESEVLTALSAAVSASAEVCICSVEPQLKPYQPNLAKSFATVRMQHIHGVYTFRAVSHAKYLAFLCLLDSRELCCNVAQ